MANINDLDQQAHLLGVKWNKAINYYNTFATDFFVVKKEFDEGKYPGWTFAMWLGQKAGLVESQCLAQIKNFANIMAHEHKEATNIALRDAKDKKLEAKIASERKSAAKADELRKIREEERAKELAELTARETFRKEAAKKRPKKKPKPKAARPSRPIVVPMAAELEQVASEIREAQLQVDQGRQGWIEGTLRLAKALVEARGICGSNQKFSEWLAANGFDYQKNDRAALINFGHDLTAAREALERSNSTSWRLIWDEMQAASTVVSMG